MIDLVGFVVFHLVNFLMTSALTGHFCFIILRKNKQTYMQHHDSSTVLIIPSLKYYYKKVVNYH